MSGIPDKIYLVINEHREPCVSFGGDAFYYKKKEALAAQRKLQREAGGKEAAEFGIRYTLVTLVIAEEE